jgi:hypothetical protein
METSQAMEHEVTIVSLGMPRENSAGKKQTVSEITMRKFLLAFALVHALALEALAESGKLEFTVTADPDGERIPCRIHLKDAAGKPGKADPLPFFFDHFVCEGTVSLSLPVGEYSYEVERGPEWSRAAGKAAIQEGETTAAKIELKRLVDLPKEGWWPGELHVHRPVGDIELLMRAEDLHVAPVITWWNARNTWAGKEPPADLLTKFDGNRFYHVMGGEDEREGGALLYFGLSSPLPITKAEREYPPPSIFLAEARQNPKAWVDIEKPFWFDAPVWLAEGADSIGIANNHMCRSKMYEDEAWGKRRDAERLAPPRGNGFWTQEIYYQILNCGLRVPPSAGSASGVLPNPVGYNRVYVHTDGELTWDKWWAGLRAGRSFVTNGPLLRVRAGGELPGHVFTGSAGSPVELELKAELTTQDPVREIEIIKDGTVERRIPIQDWAKTGSLGKVTFDRSGWFLVRAIADEPKTFRFASTAPFYVEIGDQKRRVSKASAQFFVDWVRERSGRIKLDDPAKREEVVQYQRAAEKFWLGKIDGANAE